MDAGWNASAKRYTGGKILVASLPGVEVGSTIEVEFEIAFTNAPFIAGFESFQLPDELEQKTFTLTAPAGVKIQRLVSGAPGIVDSRQTSNGGKQEFQWHSDKVAALPAETQLPPEWVYAAGVGYFVGNAANYFKELNETMLDRSHQSTKAAELARRLTANATKPDRIGEGHPRFCRQDHPRCRAVVHRTAVERTVRRRHDAGGRIRPRGGPRHSASRDAERRRVSSPSSCWPRACRPSPASQTSRWHFPCQDHSKRRSSGSRSTA